LLIDGALRPADKSERAHLIDTMVATLIAGIAKKTARTGAPA
jgi:hypothetical protein